MSDEEVLHFLNSLIFGIIGVVIFVSITFTVAIVVKHYRPALCSRGTCATFHDRDAVVRQIIDFSVK